jgi:phosphate transport system substrate-binding protein
MFIRKWSIPLAVTLLLALFLAACGSSATPSAPNPTVPAPAPSTPQAAPPAGSGTLNGAGATFPAPLYTKWFDEYNKLTGVKVNYQAVGSGAGINQITEGTVDFGASDAIMTADQQSKAEKAGGPILHIPMTSGAVAVIFNLPGINGIKLNGDVLSNIYLKTIKNWNDPQIKALNPDLVNLPGSAIAVVHRSDGSGTTYIFTSYLSKVSPTWSSQVGSATAVNWPGDIGGQGNAGVAGQVQQTPFSIGYVELAYAKQNNMPWAVLKNAAGNYQAPSLEGTTKSAEGITLPDDMKVMITNSSNPDAYPISGFTWILAFVNQKDKANGTTLANMLWWAIHDGQKFGTPLDYASLSPSATSKAENLIKSMKYQGQPLLNK